MIKINSITFGNIEVKDSSIYHFPKGIVGLPKSDKYIILDRDDSYPFKWLQALAPPYLTMMLMDPVSLMPDYGIDLKPEHTEALQLDSELDAYIMVPVRVPTQPLLMTANFLGPVIFNFVKRIGYQAHVDGPKNWLRLRVYPDFHGEETGEDEV